MTKLLAVLKQYWVPADVLGQQGGIHQPEMLRGDLERLLAHLRAMLWGAVVIIAVVFVVEIVVGLMHLQSPEVLAGVAGAMGLTGTGAIEAIRRIAREMAQVNLLVVLASQLDGEALAHVVNALVIKLQ